MLRIIITLCLTFLFVAAVYLLSGSDDERKTLEVFFTALKNDDSPKAFEVLSDDLKNYYNTPVNFKRTALTDNVQPVKWKYNKRTKKQRQYNINRGFIYMKNGVKGGFRIQLKRKNKSYRITHFSFPDNEKE